MREMQSQCGKSERAAGVQALPDRQSLPAAGAQAVGTVSRCNCGSHGGREPLSEASRVRGGAAPRAEHALLRLQRTYGNRYVQRVLAIARQSAGGGEVGSDVEAKIEGARGGGQGLHTEVQRQMESAFGSDFSGVRVHTGSEAHELNRAVDAVAFTTGQDIFFRSGAYNPGNAEGKELLAHELTHVVQQNGAGPLAGAAQRLPIQRMCAECEKENKTRLQAKLEIGQPDDAYEREAEQVGRAVAQRLSANATTRNPAGSDDGDDAYTVNGDGGVPSLDGGVASNAAVPMAGGAGAPVANTCSVKRGPSYNVSGNVPVTNAGGRKKAPFTFSAAFNTDAATGKTPSCCEVHQFIKWDSAFATARGGPPHSGFPSGAAADTWIEDRDQAGKRYGYRSGPFSDPGPGFDEYKPNQLTGDQYVGSDSPTVPAAWTGQWQFKLEAADSNCNGGAVRATSSVITVKW